ncbi:hypothetical protein D9M70_596460 [compost metagenome]
MPSAKATSVCGEVNSRSPVNWLTIFTVTVVIGSKGLICMRAATPAASTTIIVSPTARDAVRSSAPTMPGSAAGRITFLTVSERVAPRPSEPSRNARGTWVMMSSESDDTNGISMMPMTMPAVTTLCAWMKF